MAPANPGPPQLCPILRLPNEVLVDIIERVAAWPDNVDYYGFRNLYADRWAMTLVCRRFHTLTMPLLYSTITLRDVIEPPFPELRSYAIPMSVPRKTVLLLHRSVKNNRGLGQLCRELVLDLRASAVDARSAVLDAAADLIDWLGSAKVLRIRDVSKDCHPGAYTSCLSAAWAMPNLEQITLSGLPTLLAVLVLKDSMSLSIKELRLTAASNRSSPDSWIFEDEWNWKGQGLFTELWISDFHDRQYSFSVLVAWPRRLESFTFLGTSRFGYHHVDFKFVWSCLVPHALSLESIRIGSISNQNQSLDRMLAAVDFSPFERLRYMSLSYWATGADKGAENLLAPGLQVFEWTFEAEDQRPVFLDDFERREEDFLRKLAAAAIAREVPLREIVVKFSPRPITRVYSEVGLVKESELLPGWTPLYPVEYPWDRMDRVAREILPSGIRLSYSKPTVTRDQFKEALAAPLCSESTG